MTDSLVIKRIFDAPVEKVFAAWTTREAMGRWWGPKDWDIGVLGFDFRPGGHFHYRMTTRGGDNMWGRMNFQEIIPNERITWVNAFADESGNIVPAPFPGEFPVEVQLVCQFLPKDGETEITLTGEPINASEGERAFYRSMFASMEAGFGGTLDLLQAYLGESDREIVISRHIDVPIEKVFEAWTDPDRIANWWGLDGLTTTSDEFDFRSGGTWRFVFHTQDGDQYPNVVRYKSILPPYKIDFSLRDDVESGATGFDVIAAFDTEDTGTRVTMRSIYDTPAERDQALERGSVDGGQQTLRRLDDYLTTVQVDEN